MPTLHLKPTFQESRSPDLPPQDSARLFRPLSAQSCYAKASRAVRCDHIPPAFFRQFHLESWAKVSDCWLYCQQQTLSISRMCWQENQIFISQASQNFEASWLTSLMISSESPFASAQSESLICALLDSQPSIGFCTISPSTHLSLTATFLDNPLLWGDLLCPTVNHRCPILFLQTIHWILYAFIEARPFQGYHLPP